MFVILGEAPLKHEPTETPLDNPALGEHLEALARDARHDLHEIPEHEFGPADQTGLVAAVHEDFGEAGPRPEQPEQHAPSAPRVGDPGGVHHDGQQQPQGVDGDMALAALDPLATVEAALPPF